MFCRWLRTFSGPPEPPTSGAPARRGVAKFFHAVHSSQCTPEPCGVGASGGPSGAHFGSKSALFSNLERIRNSFPLVGISVCPIHNKFHRELTDAPCDEQITFPMTNNCDLSFQTPAGGAELGGVDEGRGTRSSPPSTKSRVRVWAGVLVLWLPINLTHSSLSFIGPSQVGRPEGSASAES